jgi:hypothetical protein
VACEIALTITVKIEPPRHHPTCYGSLPDSGVDHFALPFNIGRKADVHCDKGTHNAPSFQLTRRVTSSAHRSMITAAHADVHIPVCDLSLDNHP